MSKLCSLTAKGYNIGETDIKVDTLEQHEGRCRRSAGREQFVPPGEGLVCVQTSAGAQRGSGPVPADLDSPER